MNVPTVYINKGNYIKLPMSKAHQGSRLFLCVDCCNIKQDGLF